MRKTEYIAPAAEVLVMAVTTVIAQSYGALGHAGEPIDEDPINGW